MNALLKTQSLSENESKLAGIDHQRFDLAVVEPVLASGCGCIAVACDVFGAGKESWELPSVATVANFQCCRPEFATGQCAVASHLTHFQAFTCQARWALVSACGNHRARWALTVSKVDLPFDRFAI
jgi:hypothetical protein